MTFEVPERLMETLVLRNIAPDAAFALAHPPEEGLVDPTDWETEFFSKLEPEKIFSSLGHSSPCLERPEHHSPPFVKDLVSIALTEKKGYP